MSGPQNDYQNSIPRADSSDVFPPSPSPSPSPLSAERRHAGLDAPIKPGDAVTVQPKSAFRSTSLYGLLTLILAYYLRKHVSEEFRQAALDTWAEIADWLAPALLAFGAGLVAWGRTHATRPLTWTGRKEVTKLVKCVAVPMLLFSVLAATAGGCGTSQSYKQQVADLYPKIATRMELVSTHTNTPLTPHQAGSVAALRAVAPSENPGSITYERARPVWDDARQDYVDLVTNDQTLTETRRQDWLETAAILDETQRLEQERKSTLFPAASPAAAPATPPQPKP